MFNRLISKVISIMVAYLAASDYHIVYNYAVHVLTLRVIFKKELCPHFFFYSIPFYLLCWVILNKYTHTPGKSSVDLL